MPMLFPLWQVDHEEYDAICSYLNLSPNPRLYEKLSGYLAAAPFRSDRPAGFSAFLAALHLTRFRIARLDLVTKLKFRNHRLRHAINGVLALHECDPDGYREMSASPIGWTVVPKVLGWGFGFALRLMITAPWLGWQAFRYAVNPGLRAGETLQGKHVLITGVSRGLGSDIMLHCLEQGAKVIGIVRDRETADNVRASLPVEAPVTLLTADLATPGDLVEKLRGAQIRAETLALAVLCAGVKHDGESVLTLPSLRDTFEVNFFSAAEFAAWFCAEGNPEALSGKAEDSDSAGESRSPATQARQRGDGENRAKATLVVISSIGRWHGMRGTCGYNASKAALSIWSESLEMELRQSKGSAYSITIVEPGMFQSGMTGQSLLTRLLAVPRRKLAAQIVSGALAGRQSIRAPRWFALLTWGVCLLGRNFRYRLFSRVKPRASS